MLVCIYMFFKTGSKIRGIRKKIVAYLEEKNDFDTLYKIGEYNKYGHKEGRRTYGQIAALREKFEKTNDIEYKRFADTSISLEKKFFIFLFGGGISSGVLFLVLSNFGLPHTW